MNIAASQFEASKPFNHKNWIYRAPPSQKVWNIMMAIASGEAVKSIACRFSVTSAYVSGIAREQGLTARPASRSTAVFPHDGDYAFFIDGKYVLIEQGDIDLVRARRWQINPTGYVISGCTLLHRALLNADTGQIADHINGNKLDCRRSNLRLVSSRENVMNKRSASSAPTIFKGVSRQGDYWQASISLDGVRKPLGKFKNPVNAAAAYDAAARKLFGNYARLNFPEDGEQCAIEIQAEKNLQALINHNFSF